LQVSVIIPAYNALAYLPQALESVQTQTFTDFELIVVDDGSSDGTAAWLGTLTGPRLKVLCQPHQGSGAARNTGLEHAAGRYVAFLDADDLWQPTKLAKQVSHLDAHPEVGLVHSAISYIDEVGRPINRVLSASGNGQVWRQMLEANLVRCGSTPMIRRCCFSKAGTFDTTLTVFQDWEMWIRIAKHYPFAVLDEPLAAYRQHPANISKSYRLMETHFRKIIEGAFQDVPADVMPLKNRAYGRAYLHTAWRALYAGDSAAAFRLQLRALRYYPRLLYTKNSIHLTLKLTRLY